MDGTPLFGRLLFVDKAEVDIQLFGRLTAAAAAAGVSFRLVLSLGAGVVSTSGPHTP